MGSAGMLASSYLMTFAAGRSDMLQEEWLDKHRRAMKQYDLEAVYHEVKNFHGLIEQIIEVELDAGATGFKGAETLHREIVVLVQRFIGSAEKLIREAKANEVERFKDNKVDVDSLKNKVADAREWLGLTPPRFINDPHFRALAKKYCTRPTK